MREMETAGEEARYFLSECLEAVNKGDENRLKNLLTKSDLEEKAIKATVWLAYAVLCLRTNLHKLPPSTEDCWVLSNSCLETRIAQSICISLFYWQTCNNKPFISLNLQSEQITKQVNNIANILKANILEERRYIDGLLDIDAKLVDDVFTTFPKDYPTWELAITKTMLLYFSDKNPFKRIGNPFNEQERVEISLSVVFAITGEPGIVGTLTLTKRHNGFGEIHPDLLLLFCRMNKKFKDAFTDAWTYSKKQGWRDDTVDVSWKLDFWDGSFRDNFNGNSLGVAFAVGLMHLFDPKLPKLNPKIPITGAINEKGEVDAIGGLYSKIEGTGAKEIDDGLIDKNSRGQVAKLLLPKQNLDDTFKNQYSQLINSEFLVGFSSIKEASELASISLFKYLKPSPRNKSANSLIEIISKVTLVGESEPRPLDTIFAQLKVFENYQNPSALNDNILKEMSKEKLNRTIAVFNENKTDTQKKLIYINNDAEEKRQIVADDLWKGETSYFVIGSPGTGKSTLLKYIAYKIMTCCYNFPLFIELKLINWKRVTCESDNDFERILFDYLSKQYLLEDPTHSSEIKQLFANYLQDGRLVILLDGLDEINNSMPENLATVINDFQNKYLKAKFIVSARPYAFLPGRFYNMKPVEIAPLHSEQIAKFVRRYYPNYADTKGMLELLKRPELTELARNPFMLTILTKLFNRDYYLNKNINRISLYENIISDLAHEQEKGISRFKVADKTGGIKLKVLTQLAFDGLFKHLKENKIEASDKQNVFSREEIEATVTKCFKSEKERLSFKELTDDIINTPLLRLASSNSYIFSHLTLQEFLAAKALSEHEDCEAIFYHAYFDTSLTELEVIPIFLGLSKNQAHFFQLLENQERFPESFTYTNIRLRARALAYITEDCDGDIYKSVDNLMKDVKKHLLDKIDPAQTSLNSLDLPPFFEIVIKSFSLANTIFAKNITNYFEEYYKADDGKLAKVLGLLGNSYATELLCDLLKKWRNNKSTILLKAAASALGQVQNPTQNPRVIKELEASLFKGKHEYTDIYPSVASALEKIKYGNEAIDINIVNKLVKGLTSKKVHSSNGLWAKTVGAIVALNIQNEEVRQNMIENLPDYPNEEVLRILPSMFSIEHAEQMMSYLNAPSSSTYLRCLAIRVLSEIGYRQASSSIIALLNSEISSIRLEAARSLGRLKVVEAEDKLINRCTDEDSSVRASAVWALGEMRCEEAENILEKALFHDQSPRVRASAAEALSKLKTTSTNSLIEALEKEKELLVQSYIIRAVGDLKSISSTTINKLKQLVVTSVRELHYELLITLGKLQDKSSIFNLIQKLLDTEDLLIKNAAAKALLSFKPIEIREALANCQNQQLLNFSRYYTKNFSVSPTNKTISY